VFVLPHSNALSVIGEIKERISLYFFESDEVTFDLKQGAHLIFVAASYLEKQEKKAVLSLLEMSIV
jgi:hypothetical protein